MVLFRADASVQLGIGHVMRCLAIAQAWQDSGGQAAFVCHGHMPALRARLHSEGMEVFQLVSEPGSVDDAIETAKIASSTNAEWLCVDGYHFGSRYLQQLRSPDTWLALIDDYGERERYGMELVVNPNIFGQREMYQGRLVSGELLTGLDYALLRREFRSRRAREVVAPALATKLLITVGGSDPNNLTLQLLSCINDVDIDDLEVTIVSGGASPHHEALRAAAQDARHRVRLLVDVRDMPGILSGAEAVISAAGGTCAELALLGIPMMLVTIAENHARNAEEYAAHDLAVSLGWCAKLDPGAVSASIESFLRDPALRRRIAQNALTRIDGTGAVRVAQAMKRIASAKLQPMALRNAP